MPKIKTFSFSRLYLLFFILVFIFQGSAAFAQSASDILSTPFYDPTGSDSSSCVAGGASSSSLPSAIKDAINKLQPDYAAAAQKTGVPWQLLAAIHYRENSNSPNGDLQAGNPIGGPYSQQSTAYQTYGYPKSIEESAEIAGKMISSMSKKPINVPNPDPEVIKDALFSYNGRAAAYAQQAADLGFNPDTQPYEGSPYVMNNYDQKHQNMKIITKDNGPLDGVDTRYGAFTIYSLLGGGTGSSGSSCTGGAVAGDAVQTAIKYAWPDYHPADYFNMKPAYAAATQTAEANNEYVGGGSHPGIDCGGFITRVMRDSGVDPNYNQNNGDTVVQMQYLNSHPEKYQKLSNVTGTSDLQPGDIAINSDHTYMYVGSQPGFNGNSASASYGSWRAPMASNAYNFTNFAWYRLIKQGS